MEMWGIEWPSGWAMKEDYIDAKYVYKEAVLFRNADGYIEFEILRYYAALARQAGITHVKEYAAVSLPQPGQQVSGYIGFYDTPNETLAACMFYVRRQL